MKQVKLLFIIAFFCAAIPNLRAQNLATWTFTNASGDWGSSPKAPTSADANVTVVGLTRGSGIGTSGTAAGTAWGGNGFSDGLSTQTAATAVAQGNFITFSFTANPGFRVSISGIPSYNIRRSGTGPTSMIWQYSLNGTDFTDIGTTITIGTTTTSSGNTKPAISLSGIPELQDVSSGTTITFRAAMWGASQDAGTWYLNSATGASFSVTGTATSTPLSLNLISFKGKTENNINQLDWATANEKDFSRFELERGTDGSNFTRITVVDAKGNNNATNNHYTYKDAEADKVGYYRLKMIDVDGKTILSNIVVLHQGNDSKHNIRIYPNPATSNLFLEGTGNTLSYSITDVAGRTIVPSTFMNAENALMSIDISSLNEGIYFLQVVTGSNKETIRFIKK